MKSSVTTEKEQAALVGTPVKVEDWLEPKNKHYVESAWDNRKPGMTGRIIGYSNSHGLCFHVRHNDGTAGWYDPEELTEVEDEEKGN